MRIRRTVDELPGPGVTATATATEGLIPKDLKEPPLPPPFDGAKNRVKQLFGHNDGFQRLPGFPVYDTHFPGLAIMVHPGPPTR